MRESYELAWITAYLFSHVPPNLRSSDDMTFLKVEKNNLRNSSSIDLLYIVILIACGYW
jgi:hypothetical protein